MNLSGSASCNVGAINLLFIPLPSTTIAPISGSIKSDISSAPAVIAAVPTTINPATHPGGPEVVAETIKVLKIPIAV